MVECGVGDIPWYARNVEGGEVEAEAEEADSMIG
jgi:hypothetical protein